MDIRSYVNGIIDIFPGPLKTPARWVADRVFGVWNDVSEVFRVQVSPWRYLADAVAYALNKAVAAAERGALAIRWLATVYVPRGLNALQSIIVDWASKAIDGLTDWATKTFNSIIDWAWQHLLSISDYLTKLRDWLLARFDDIWKPLNIVIDRVGMLLFDPKKFAQWAIGAVWEAFWRYAMDHLDGIVDVVWSRRTTVLSKTIDQLEATVERLL